MTEAEVTGTDTAVEVAAADTDMAAAEEDTEDNKEEPAGTHPLPPVAADTLLPLPVVVRVTPPLSPADIPLLRLVVEAVMSSQMPVTAVAAGAEQATAVAAALATAEAVPRATETRAVSEFASPLLKMTWMSEPPAPEPAASQIRPSSQATMGTHTRVKLLPEEEPSYTNASRHSRKSPTMT